MVFKCQENSFLREFTTKVVSCATVKFIDAKNGKKVTKEGFEVICEDTIIFPEGGGQPCDHGRLNDVEVYQVKRRGDTAIHYVEQPLQAGDTVKQVIDWNRRLDHMQQHSGQHLITAVIDREFQFSTVSWWLGEEVSYIELDTPSVTPEQVAKVENLSNELIRASKQVTVQVIKENSVDLGDQVHARGLPKDHKGDIRIVTIEGIESNMCCGTHVTNLCQLQTIKLLHTEKSSRKGNTLLYFLVGNRVLVRLAALVEREQKLTGLLNNGPSKHVELVEKLINNVKGLNKKLQSQTKELVAFEVAKLKAVSPAPRFYSLYRKDADTDFMNLFVREINTTDIFLFLCVGEEKGIGNIMLYGSEDAVLALGKKISDLLDGKGSGKGNKFQAKVSNMGARKKVEDLLKEYYQ